MQIAFGDHQVSNYAADTVARTIGAQTNCPSFDSGRVPDTRLLWGVPCISSFPYSASAIVDHDSGAALPLLDRHAADLGKRPARTARVPTPRRVTRSRRS